MDPFTLSGNKSQYLVEKEIGRGGLGIVYQARALEYDLTVAVKQAGLEPITDEKLRVQVRAQQKHQLNALGPLDHPNVSKVYDQFSDDAHEYLVMEFLQGSTLQKILYQTLDQERLLEESRVIGWALQVLDGLEYLHNQPQPIIHRDLKPDNLFLNRDGRVVMVDFGLMKQQIDRKHAGPTSDITHAMGTVEYAPLEQYAESGSRTDTRTDLYSLGATLYHLLAGRLPPRAVDRLMTASMVETLAKRPPSLRKINPTVGIRTEQIIFKAMEIDPKERYHDARDMRKHFNPRRRIMHLSV